jgi:putative transposase
VLSFLHPSSRANDIYTDGRAVRYGSVSRAVFATGTRPGCRESLPAQTADSVSGASSQTETRRPGKRSQSQRWSTFLRNHAKGIVACNFCVAVTATFRVLYVFVIIEHASRRLLHVNVTACPTAQWVIQQFCEAIPADHTYRILIHDRDAIFSKAVDQSGSHMRLQVIKTPMRTPVANAICERVIGTLRRECLDFMISLHEKHLYGILKEWVTHYNEGRPYMSLGPGIPKPRRSLPVSLQAHRHWLRSDQCIVSQPIFSGLHQDYRLEKKAA